MNLENLKQAMIDLDEDTVNNLVDDFLTTTTSSEETSSVIQTLQAAMQTIGEYFEDGTYFVGDLIYAGEIMTDLMNKLNSIIIKNENEISGKVIICTVKGDLHDIGKNIVRSMLQAAGLNVIDLGIDVPANKILETIKNENVKIVALSGVLTLALDSMKEIISEIKSYNKDIKVIIGGAPVSESACIECQADEWAHSPQKTVDTCTKWASELY